MISRVYNWIFGHKLISIMVTFGLFIRLILAKQSQYNFDMTNFINDTSIFRQGHFNIFQYQPSYNYSPAFFFILGILGKIQEILSFLSFPFIERGFISLVDLATLGILMRIAFIKKIPLAFPVLFFFLNPVTIIISGYHGQFDNIAIFFLLLGILLDLENSSSKLYIWFSVTLGLIIKHIILFQVPLILFHIYRNKKWKAFALFVFSCILFLLTFAPFYGGASKDITENVFKYQGLATLVGVTHFLYIASPTGKISGMHLYEAYKYLFMIASFLFVIALSKYDLLKGFLLSLLFFLAFTSAIAAQYFMLPIAIGALFPNRWFFSYTIIVTFFLLGSEAELNIALFKPFSYDIAWIFAILWFLAEFANIDSIKRVYVRTLVISQKFIKKL